MRVLFLTHRLPYAPNRGDRVRAFHLLRLLRPVADVDVISLVHDAAEASHASDLHAVTASVRVAPVTKWRNLATSGWALTGRTPLTHTLLASPALRPAIEAAVRDHRPDVVLAYCSGMARLALAAPLQKIPFVLDMVDVDSAKWAALGSTASPPRSWIYRREARTLARFEADASRQAFSNLVVTERERETLATIAPRARIEVVQNGVDVVGLRPPTDPMRSAKVVFCGVMNYAPNEEGATFLAREVWPLVRRARPDAHLQLVGSNPSETVRRLADPELGVEVTGAVPDVKRYLWEAAVGTGPLLTARGIQNKVLEAVAAGLPTVVTPLVMLGLPAEVQPACRSAATAETFAAAIVDLLNQSPQARRAIANQARLGSLSWEDRLSSVIDILRSAAASSRA